MKKNSKDESSKFKVQSSKLKGEEPQSYDEWALSGNLDI
jgi:hypothetical protein